MGSSPVNNFVSFVFWKSLSEHGRATFRLLFGGLSLNHVPCSTSNPSSMHKDVGSDPIYRCAESRKLPVHNDEIALCNDRSSLRRATETRLPNDPNPNSSRPRSRIRRSAHDRRDVRTLHWTPSISEWRSI